MTINYNQTPKAILIQMANDKNGTTVHPSDVEITDVIEVDPAQFNGRNTQFTVRPAGLNNNTAGIGFANLWYTRLDATEFFQGDVRIEAAPETIQTPLDLLVYINSAYSVQIPPDYIDLTNSTWNPTTRKGVLVFDHSKSWIWLNSVSYTVYGLGEYLDRSLIELFTDTDITPFTLPTPPTT